MDSLKRAMRWDEERFGREYDLDTFMIFCADDFNLGAMENKGLNIFNSRLLLADAAMATDDDFSAIEAVIAHEYFHNWTGNRVTCRDWFQLSLKEGLTVFRDQEFSSDQGSRAVERIGAVEYLRREQFAEDAGPMAHPVRPDEYQEINNFYTATVYEKGAELIRMQHALLGADRFRDGMDLYFERHDGQAVTCDEFVQSMQDASGVDLAQFRNWYAQAGTPVVTVRGSYDAPARTYVLDVEQSVPSASGSRRRQPLHLPLAVGLDRPRRVRHAVAPCRRARGGGHDARPRAEIGRAALRIRRRRRPPPFLRCCVDFRHRCGSSATTTTRRLPCSHRTTATPSIAGMPRNARTSTRSCGSRTPTATVFRSRCRRCCTQVVRRLLDDDASDPSLRALALELPDAAYVASLEPVIDPDGIGAALAFVERALAAELRDAFESAYRRHRLGGAYAWQPRPAGCTQPVEPVPALSGRARRRRRARLAIEQFDAADNMTDSIGALRALRDSLSPARDAIYRRFEAKWRDEPLALDKWFDLQAQSARGDTLAMVRTLIAHPRFNARNPNRVRSLVGAFALRNFARFNAADGAGYTFAAEQVRALDTINPQLASTIAGAFNLWKRFAEPRRTQMQRSLERIARTRGLSPDVGEVVMRTLARCSRRYQYVSSVMCPGSLRR